jgi:hypothetical protein
VGILGEMITNAVTTLRGVRDALAGRNPRLALQIARSGWTVHLAAVWLLWVLARNALAVVTVEPWHWCRGQVQLLIARLAGRNRE